MDVCRLGSYCPPGSTFFEEDDPMLEEMRQEAARSVLVTNPQPVDISGAVQLGYVNFEGNEVMIGGGIGIHYRPIFNLEANYDFTIQGLDTLGGSGAERTAAFMHNLGVTIINTLSEEGKTNIGLHAAFAAMNLLGGGIQNFIGVTGGIELGNYSPRLYLDYTYLNDLSGQSFHQAMLGLRVFFEIS